MSTVTGGIGKISVGETNCEKFPDMWPRARLHHGIVFCHSSGATGDNLHLATLPGLMKLGETLTKAGYPIVGTDLGSTQNFGNTLSRTRITTVVNYEVANNQWIDNKIHFLTTSMGAFAALNYARENPTLVKSCILLLPPINMDDFYQRDDPAGIRALIQTAMGIVYPAPIPAGNDPWVESKNYSCPIMIRYCADDASALPIWPFRFASMVGADIKNIGNFGHTDTAIQNVNHDEIVEFLRKADV